MIHTSSIVDKKAKVSKTVKLDRFVMLDLTSSYMIMLS